jgi:hypothetical protein
MNRRRERFRRRFFIALSHLAKHFAKKAKVDWLSSRPTEAPDFDEIARRVTQVTEIPRFRRL